MKASTLSIVLSVCLAIGALFLGISLFFAELGGCSALLLPACILHNSFRAAAWYLPIYLGLCSALLLLQELKPLILYFSSTAVVPVITSGFWMQTMGNAPRSAAASALLDRFGEGGSSFLLFLVLLLELAIIYLIALRFFIAGGGISEDSDAPVREKEKREESRALPEPITPASEEVIEEEDDDLWWEEFQRRGHVYANRELEEELGKEAEIEELPDLDSEEEEDDPEAPVDLIFRKLRSSQEGSSVYQEELPEQDNLDEDEVFVEELEDEDEDEDDFEEDLDVDIDDEIEEDSEEELPPPVEAAPDPELSAEIERRIESYDVPREEILDEYPDSKYHIIDEATRQSAEVLKETLKEFKIQAEVTGIRKGPVITMFEILPAPGVKLSKIVNLADNIALRLAASRVRIVAPIPGKHAVGIEVPNRKRALVSFKEMIDDKVFQNNEKAVPIVLGKDITGETQIVDLVQTPHLLIAGATGSGKSVCVNSIICSILYQRSPEEVKMILIDPKIVELKLYNDIPHLLTPVITEPKRAFQALQYCLYEMERRYALLDALGVRDIKSYNKKIKKKRMATRPLPYLVVIVDEFADLMATTGKELESTLARLAAMSRAVGIHLVLATQRPSIDVITGLIKANIPSRIAFMVAGKFDSRIIIDAVGAEKLLGRGDMLFTSAWDPVPTRIQGAFLSEDEVERVADYVRTLGEPDYIDDEIFIDDEESDTLFDSGSGDDPLMEKALEIVASAGKASASYLQRRLKIGYNRAARLVEEMEERGIVGPQNGSKPREIIHVPDRFREGRDAEGVD